MSDLLSRLAVALGIGLLTGLERGWRARDARPGGRTAGIRTFALSGLLGGIVAALAGPADGKLAIAGAVLLVGAFVAYALVVATFSRDENRATNTFSATTTVAALLTFVLGAYALIGDTRVAVAAAVVTVGLLLIREELHGWVEQITAAEFRSGLILLAMTFIALPFMPNRALAMLGGVNPREIWIIAIVLAVVSFAGYVAVRLFGERRGILIAAAAGGLVSSTAVTFAYARRAAAEVNPPRQLAGGAALATAVSFIRVAAIVAVLQPSLFPAVAPALIVAAVASTGLAFAAIRWHPVDNEERIVPDLRNPFAFWAVLAAAATMGGLIAFGRYIDGVFGAPGAIASAAAVGLFDVDAMTVSISRLVPGSLNVHSAAIAILIGVASNLLSKIAIAIAIGGRTFATYYAIISAIALSAAGLSSPAAAALFAKA
jgi:uncharacterized membrane protein (DUF4010 family)